MADETPQPEMILYQTADGRTRIQCRFEKQLSGNSGTLPTTGNAGLDGVCLCRQPVCFVSQLGPFVSQLGPNGARLDSPGRSPGLRNDDHWQAPTGRDSTEMSAEFRPVGADRIARVRAPGLRPGLSSFDPSGRRARNKCRPITPQGDSKTRQLVRMTYKFDPRGVFRHGLQLFGISEEFRPQESIQHDEQLSGNPGSFDMAAGIKRAAEQDSHERSRIPCRTHRPRSRRRWQGSSKGAAFVLKKGRCVRHAARSCRNDGICSTRFVDVSMASTYRTHACRHSRQPAHPLD